MIRYLTILTVFVLMAGAGTSVAAQQVYLGGDKKESAKPVFNTSGKSSKTTVYKGDAQQNQQSSKDLFAQLLEENQQADFEIIKNESLKTKQQIMENRAARAAAEKAMQEEVAKHTQSPEMPLEPVAEEEKQEENVKKVYIGKSSNTSKPKKVFNSYD